MGHVLAKEGLSLDPERVEDILQVPTPQNRKDLQVFLGMVNFVARFVPNMSALSAPLRELLKKDIAWNWSDLQENSFQHLRAALMQAPVLAYFRQDQPVVLSVDASQYGVGAVLLQNGQPVAYSSRSLTAAQQRYAQIEKEALAIVHGCTKFQDYIFGQPEVMVESDHRPLEMIFKKPLCECPLRLQRMRLVLQRFPITVTYKPGKELLLADALSRFPSKVQLQEETEQFEVNAVSFLPIADDQLRSIRESTKNDALMSQLLCYTKTDWPETRLQVPDALRAFWAYRDELHTEDGLLLRSNKLIIPPAKRREVLHLLHAAHGGQEKMKARARQVMFWPSMNSDIAALANSCHVCQKYKNRNAKLPMLSHPVPSLPWQSVGMDLFHYGGSEYLIIVDFYSFFFEIRQLRHTTAQAVIQACMEVFATHGIPANICSDNGPPFSSANFRSFTSHFHVNHVTSSPYYPRGNGMAERAVQEAKKLLKKCSFGTFEFCSAMLEWRNSPRDDLLQSPSERLMGRRTRTRLPVLDCHLKPKTIPTETVRSRLEDIRSRQQKYYKSARHLPDLHSGSAVSIYDTLQRTWAPAVVLGTAGTPRSYILDTGSGHLRRTREHLRTTKAEIQDPPSQTEPPGDTSTQEVTPEDGLRRSTRQRREPQRFPLPERRT